MRDLTGLTVGRLTVIEPTSERTPQGSVIWRCLCECGRYSFVRSGNLTHGTSKSCGCRRGGFKHGKSHTPEWEAWQGMKSRCSNPRNTAYSYYGGRGIRVDPIWQESFEAFYEVVGDRPTVEHSLDRIDSDGHYEPGNVRWATPLEQAKNTVPMRGMSFNHYQARVTKTAIYPGSGEILGLMYCLLGLAEEAGEAAGKMKKCLRDQGGEMDAGFRARLLAELGDVLWYTAQACNELNVKLDTVAHRNLDKVSDRAERGVLGGSGDDR